MSRIKARTKQDRRPLSCVLPEGLCLSKRFRKHKREAKGASASFVVPDVDLVNFIQTSSGVFCAVMRAGINNERIVTFSLEE